MKTPINWTYSTDRLSNIVINIIVNTEQKYSKLQWVKKRPNKRNNDLNLVIDKTT